MKSTIKKLGISLGAASFIGTTMATTVVNTFAATDNSVSNSNENQNDSSYGALYGSLTKDQQDEFDQIVNGAGLNEEQQNTLLQDKITEQNNNLTRGLKLETIKKIAKYVAKITGNSLKTKPLKAFVNFLTDYEGKAEDGIRYALIHYLHLNSTVAYWTARTVVFIYL